MKNILEGLWDDYFSEQCAVIDTEEERALTKRVAELHKTANALLSKEQSDAIEKYVDELCDIQAIFAKKAFLKGCEFASSFLWEVGHSEKPSLTLKL